MAAQGESTIDMETSQTLLFSNTHDSLQSQQSSPTRPPLDPSASRTWEGPSLGRHERKSTASSVFSSTSFVSGLTVLECPPFDPSNTTTLANGVIYEYFQGEFECMPDFNGILQQRKKIGVTHTILIDSFTELGLFTPPESTEETMTEGNYAVRFTGQIHIPKDGIWTFSTTSNDGSVLYMGGKKVVDNDGQHYATEKYGKIKLQAGYYPFMLGYFHRTGKLMEGLRTGPCLGLNWYCVSQSWISQGGEYSKKQAISAQCLYYNYLNPILMPVAPAVSEESIVYDTPYSKITELQEQMIAMSTDYEDKIAQLESQLEQQKMNTLSMMQYIATAASSTTSTPSSSRLSSCLTTPHASSDTLDQLSPEKDLSMSPENDHLLLLDQVMSEIDKLKASAFFSMGLAYKLGNPCNINLHELWEKVSLENIPMESWHTVFT